MVSRVVVTLELTSERAVRWLAQILSNRLSEKDYVNQMSMSVNGDRAMDPRQVAWGMTDEEFADHQARWAESIRRTAAWNKHCAELHARRRELEEAGRPYDEALAQAKSELAWNDG